MISKIKLLSLLTVFSLLSTFVMGQVREISGVVEDAKSGEGLPGVTVLVKESGQGVATDVFGNFKIKADKGNTIVFSFIGYQTENVLIQDQKQLTVKLKEEAAQLDEVVVIGYGQVRKGDATGSVLSVGTDDFNKGAISSPQELLMGKMPGVQITTGGGAPGAGATIRIRGGSSMSASNDPLIVIDGVPMDNSGVSGMRNPLNTINPADIETFTVLKDASATAIYGSRASNGVILITTKKGKQGSDLKVNYSGNVSINSLAKKMDVLSADEYRALIVEEYGADSDQVKLLGDANTDWQDEIFRTSVSHDHNISLAGSYKALPYRVSYGYTDQNGILKNSSLKRHTVSANLNPSFFKDHLKVNLSAKYMNVDNRFENTGAIGAAVRMDPTQAIKDGNEKFGGYFTWTGEGDVPNVNAVANPVAMIELRDDRAKVDRFIGNAQFDYKFHFLPELKANLNLGYDVSKTDGKTIEPETASWTYDDKNGSGNVNNYSQEKKNSLLDFYLNYNKEVPTLLSRLDVMAGYSWQHFWKTGESRATNFAGNFLKGKDFYETENYLVSFFGRLNYTFNEKYLMTATVRYDGSSRFSEEARWGLFPSLALAWRIDQEGFLQNFDKLSSLKLRLGYGVTGQQDIGNDFPYMPTYTVSDEWSSYPFGDHYIPTFRPNGYDQNIQWEETKTYNVGLDFGFFDSRLSGSVDAYYKKTDNLLNVVPVPAGSNLTNMILTNVGNMENKGIELSLTGVAIAKEDMFWDVSFNAARNTNEITKLTLSDDPNYEGVAVGGISGGTGTTVQINSVGHSLNTFYLKKQVYDQAGNPIEGVYEDLNGDGKVDDNDRYRGENANPKWTLGLSSSFRYKNWDLAVSTRASIGNYVYNNVNSDNGGIKGIYSHGAMSNVVTTALDTRFSKNEYLSDHYLENASFFKLDNLTLGYNFNDLFSKKVNLRLFATGQNLLTATKYSGIDPEVFGGVDNNIYPRPRTFLFGINLDF